MKLAVCTSDFFYPVHQSIRESGHEVEKVFTSCELNTGFCDKTKEFADDMRAEFVVGRVEDSDVQDLSERGVEVLISAAYDYKIPIREELGIKCVNFHGSLLPEGRGPWPQPWILLKYPEFAGVTVHSMTNEWDLGDIVIQRGISLAEKETMDSLVGKTLVVVKELSWQLLADFHSLWEHRQPMKGKGSYWRKPNETDRTISFEKSVESIERIYQAFGEFTTYIDTVTNDICRVAKLSTWKQQHEHRPGKCITMSPPRVIYAALDGYVAIIPTKRELPGQSIS